MNYKEELKPCPFCGKSVMEVSNEGQIPGEDYFIVVCNAIHGGCGSASGYALTPELAVEIWNKRFEKEIEND